MRLLLLVLAVAGLALDVARAEEACPDESDLTVPNEGGGLYVAIDVCDLHAPCAAVWLFQESNGVAGLQRCDEFPVDGNECCGGRGDTVLF